MSGKRYLYLFSGILSDYTPGIAGAVAGSKKEAIDTIVQRFESDAKQHEEYEKKVAKIKNSPVAKKLISDMTEWKKNHNEVDAKFQALNKKYDGLFTLIGKQRPPHNLGTLYYHNTNIRKELQQCKEVVKTDVNDKFGFYIGGGG
jgi:predicted  nucleic acid-binding Zn-ribbon protein